MKKEAVICIKGIQFTDGERHEIELTTLGQFYKKQDTYYITYQEPEDTGLGGKRTTLKLEDSQRVSLLRHGDATSTLIVENGIRHHCVYNTDFGSMMVGVSGGSIKSSMSDSGGSFWFKYTLDINAAVASENEVYVSVREA